MGRRSDFNSWVTRRLGWYGGFMASAVCITFLACGVAAILLRKSPQELLIPALLLVATFAATGPFFYVAAKDPRYIRIRPALGGIAILGLCGPLTIFYSALRLRFIEVGTFDGLLVSTAIGLPFLVLVSYFTIRMQLKGKKEVV